MRWYFASHSAAELAGKMIRFLVMPSSSSLWQKLNTSCCRCTGNDFSNECAARLATGAYVSYWLMIHTGTICFRCGAIFLPAWPTMAACACCVASRTRCSTSMDRLLYRRGQNGRIDLMVPASVLATSSANSCSAFTLVIGSFLAILRSTI